MLRLKAALPSARNVITTTIKSRETFVLQRD